MESVDKEELFKFGKVLCLCKGDAFFRDRDEFLDITELGVKERVQERFLEEECLELGSSMNKERKPGKNMKRESGTQMEA